MFTDMLGSVRTITNETGAIVENYDYLPFGRMLSSGVNNRSAAGFYPPDPDTNLSSRISQKFTGKERDAETGLDFFLARYYSAAQGRFLSPDEFKGGPDDALTGKDISRPGPLPYADIDNPQSINKYAYPYNNPLSYTDPDGHKGFKDWLFGKFKNEGIAKMAVYDHEPPTPPPFAILTTDIKGNKTKLFVSTPEHTGVFTIQTVVRVSQNTLKKHPGADGPFITPAVKGVNNSYANEDAYGPKGALIDVGDSRKRHIHGGGTGLPDPMAPMQGLIGTHGCTRGNNVEVINLGILIEDFKKNYPQAPPIPYRRE
jgi:RHS repeat-associated protein